MGDWNSADPRIVLIDLKRANLILLRPHPNGKTPWEAGTGQAEMKNGWDVWTSFEDCSRVETWDTSWRWSLEPARTPK